MTMFSWALYFKYRWGLVEYLSDRRIWGNREECIAGGEEDSIVGGRNDFIVLDGWAPIKEDGEDRIADGT